ncbi:LmeA family phospholipid-binding protein [Gordonia sp. NPDC003504]
MADETEGPGTERTPQDPDSTKKVDRPTVDEASAATEQETSAATEQWEPASTSQHARAYSDVSAATTSPVTPPPAAGWEAPTGTSRFPTGENPVGPETGAGPQSTGVVTTSPRRGGKGKFIALGAVGVILVVVIALVGTELFLRSRVTDCLESQFGSLTGQSTSVSLSKKPILLQKFSNDFPYVQVDTADDGSTGIRLHARADGLSQDGDALKISSLSGTGYVPFQRVIDLSAQQSSSSGGGGNGTGGSGDQNALLPSGAEVTSVVGNSTDGTVKVDATVQVAIFPVPVSLTIKPVVDQGQVHFQVEQANAFVFGIPADFAQQFVDGFGDSLFGDFTKEIQVQSLKVTDQGVDFAVSGTDVDLTGATTSSGNQSEGCSLT